MVGIELSGSFAVLVGLIGAGWIYFDGRRRRMDTADMWAVGFFVGMFIPPIIGGVVVATLYFQKRNRRGPTPVGHRRGADARSTISPLLAPER